jgi:hypothetical protein
MNRRILCTGIVLILLSVTAYSQPYQIKVDSGEVAVYEALSGQKALIKDSGNVNPGDSVFLSISDQATLRIETASRILLKGPCTIAVSGTGKTFKATLDEGQIFLDRNQPWGFDSLSLYSKGYTFVPMGTAFGLKTTKQGIPTSAVLRGKIQMQSPSGENIIVNPGCFGTVDANGKLVQGKLAPRAIGSLENWSGVKQQLDGETESTAPQQTSTPPAAPAPETAPATQPLAAPSSSQTTQEVKDTAKTAAQAVQPAPSKPAAQPSQQKPPETASVQKKQEEKKAGEKPKEQKPEGAAAKEKPQWNIGAGSVTVNGVQWTRLNLGVDIPIWKFGIFFDLECFIDDKGQFSNKSWDFEHNWAEAVSSKIRYIRFGHEQDPLFIKVGGLSDVTLGYGFIVDRFTNMLHYPDQHLLGLQFYLNDISPIGVTLQTLVADFFDFKNDGGVMAARLAFRPLKSMNIPIISGVSIGGTYGIDLNQYAPAHDWRFEGNPKDRNGNGVFDIAYWRQQGYSQMILDTMIAKGDADTSTFTIDTTYRDSTAQFGLAGGDIGIPIIRTSLINLDLYAQAGLRADGMHGWGIGAPGVSLKVWQFWANVEYRRIEGRFTPGYFDQYYLDERLFRTPSISTKMDRIPDDTLNGVFGRLGVNIVNAVILDGSYQYLVGQDPKQTDQRFEASLSIGDFILSRIPKITKAEVYYYKTNIGSDIMKYDVNGDPVYDSFFDETPFMFYGYKAGFAISQGASLIWDSRYGYTRDSKGRLKSNNCVRVQTELTF